MKIIILKNVNKKFGLIKQDDRGQGNLFHPFPGRRRITEFWALRDINMEVEAGKVIGIIGRNGAGKSTLLTLLAGITDATDGKVEVNGKVSSLLTVGAGFEDDLTGKENIHLNCSILGMSRKEISKNYNNIMEFSELDGFLDSPLKTYSTGMRVRLGFSVAIQMDFDVLLIDEILVVGDIAFQKKSYDKIIDFKRQGKTMIITSQDLNIIGRICDEVYLLENGRIEAHGEPEYIKTCYLKLLNKKKWSRT